MPHSGGLQLTRGSSPAGLLHRGSQERLPCDPAVPENPAQAACPWARWKYG